MIQKHILVTDCRINRGEWSTGNFKFVFNETRGACDAFNFIYMRFPLKRTGICTYTPGVTLKTLRFVNTLFVPCNSYCQAAFTRATEFLATARPLGLGGTFLTRDQRKWLGDRHCG